MTGSDWYNREQTRGAKLGVWIIEGEADFLDACARFRPDVVETTGIIKPDRG